MNTLTHTTGRHERNTMTLTKGHVGVRGRIPGQQPFATNPSCDVPATDLSSPVYLWNRMGASSA